MNVQRMGFRRADFDKWVRGVRMSWQKEDTVDSNNAQRLGFYFPWFKTNLELFRLWGYFLI